MRYFAILLLPIFLIACSKSEEQKRPMVLPPFSCDDTTDDGDFELWDSSVTDLVFDGNQYVINPDSVVPGYLRSMGGADRMISQTRPEFRYHAVYDTGISWYTVFVLVDPTGHIERWTLVDRNNKARASDTVQERVDLGSAAGLSAGCKRLYYYGFKQDVNAANAVLTTAIPGKVLFKGHYDVLVY